MDVTVTYFVCHGLDSWPKANVEGFEGLMLKDWAEWVADRWLEQGGNQAPAAG
jgi:hypothetical protein